MSDRNFQVVRAKLGNFVVEFPSSSVRVLLALPLRGIETSAIKWIHCGYDRETLRPSETVEVADSGFLWIESPL